MTKGHGSIDNLVFLVNMIDCIHRIDKRITRRISQTMSLSLSFRLIRIVHILVHISRSWVADRYRRVAVPSVAMVV